MGIVRNFVDGLTNALTGLGTTADPRYRNRYTWCPLTPADIEAAYRGSGLMRKVIDIPAFDSVREWRDWQADKEQIEALEEEERRLGIQAKVLEAEVLRGLGGGALVLGVPGDPAMPVSANLGKGNIAFIHVLSRWQLSGHEWVDDPTDPLYGGPRYWTMTTARGQARLHPSRVIAFKADLLPAIAATANVEDRFWGESRVQRVLDAVQDSDTSRQAFAALIVKARNTIIGIPGLTDLVSTSTGEQQLAARLAAINLGESMFNTTLRDAGTGEPGAGETVEHRQVTWTGIPDTIRVFAEAVSAASDIPMTRLWGRAAEGMNSSGDSQQRDWGKMVLAKQKLFLRPCLDLLDAVLIPSALGSRPKDVWWMFSPLDTLTETEEATRFKTTMEAVEKVQNTGAVPDEAFAKALQNTLVEGGWMPGLEGALDEIPEAERYGIEEEEELPEAANENAVEEMQQRGAINEDQARALLTDARPRTLYVRRDVVNAGEIAAWARSQGLPDLQDGPHVTVIYSRQEIDWLKVGNASDWGGDKDGKLTIPPGGPRVVEPLGDRTAVLMFASTDLQWRHRAIVEAGADHGYPDYVPHISLTGEPVDLDGVEPYRGRIVLGPEIFEELDESRA